jgi:hypothetical protein
MLTELTDQQELDESVRGTANVSFTIETRSEDANQLVKRVYTFSHAPEWDKWMFQSFVEERTRDTTRITDRHWKKTKDVTWEDPEAVDVDVPAEVSQRLEEVTEAEEVILQVPGTLQ